MPMMVKATGGDRRDPPLALADVGGLGQEIGQFAGVERALPLKPCGEQGAPARVEAAVERGDEGKRILGQHVFGAGHGVGTRRRRPLGQVRRRHCIASAAIE